MKKILVSLFFIIFYIITFSSNISWNSMNIESYQVYDYSSIANYNSSFIDISGLNKIITINYIDGNVNGFGIIQGKYGRIGITMDYEKDSIISNYISKFFNRKIYPVKLGLMLGKKIDYISVCMGFETFLLNDYYYNEEFVYDNINSHFNYFKLLPSVSIELPGDIIVEFSPQFIIKNAYYEDYVTNVSSIAMMDYSINGRIIQKNNNNYYLLYAHYNSTPYSYSINNNDIIDNYVNVNDSLNLGLIVSIESFDYINSYFSFSYLKFSNYNEITYNAGSQTRGKTTITVLPLISMGFNVYVNKYVSLLFGLKGLWENLLIEESPNMNPDNMNSYFDYNYSLGLTFSYNNLNIDIGFDNNIVSLPFFISGNTLNNAKVSLGIDFAGFEY